MKILITGGAGFIGTHLAIFLKNKGNQIYIVDNLSSNKKYRPIKKIKFIKSDLRSDKTYRKLPKKIDVVFHLASQASGEGSFENPVYDLECNTLSTLNPSAPSVNG